jgi:hypothetical protein
MEYACGARNGRIAISDRSFLKSAAANEATNPRLITHAERIESSGTCRESTGEWSIWVRKHVPTWAELIHGRLMISGTALEP